MSFAWTIPGLHRIELYIEPWNTGSVKTAERAGFKREGLLRSHDGDYVPAGEAVAVFEDHRDAERGRRFDDQADVVQEHPHPGDDRRLGDQDDAVGDGVSRAGGDD